MFKSSLRATASVLILSSLTLALPAAADDAADAGDVREVIVMGKRVIREFAGATGLDLSLRETPQSVTVITAQQIKEFGLSDANQLLDTIPGINVVPAETDRTYYNSRGFEITTFQVDGVGQPLDWGLQTGAFDTVIYDRIEAVRGATGMMTGTGNPSATINYIRKRPTKDFRANASVGYGTWDNMRLESDVSTPLNADGTVAARFVYANTDTESYLNYYGVNRNVYYGVVAWDITPRLNFTAGYSQQDNLATGNNWGALPLVYTDGTPIDYDVSETTAAPWTFWDTFSKTSFGELSYKFENGWTIKGIYTHKDLEDKAKLLYAYGNPDPVTGLGVGGMSGYYPSELKQDMFDVIVNGGVSLFGREHQVVAGLNTYESKSHKWEAFADMFAYDAYQGTHIVAPSEPTYPDTYLAEDITDKLTRGYAAIHLNISDSLKSVVGFNAIKLETTGESYAVDASREEEAVSPYVGIVYDVTPNASLYASYSDIFNPQSEGNFDGSRLPAAKGKSYEVGVKSEWFEKRLYATASVFKSEQYDLAEYAGFNPDTGKSYYIGIDTFVKGYELEVAGKITPQWTVNGGWTQMSIEGQDGNDVRTYIPRKTLKLSTTYSIPELRDLKLGGSVRWQDDISTTDLGYTVTQGSYAIVDLMGRIKLTDKVGATLNVKNAFDEKYFGSLMWSQSFYGASRSVMVSLDYTF
ncbi:TonB-dependent siderophore receptor [Asticcacaulis sp. ZE23SCel15]|uniref:TonB-dependent siderophore receptor n=1 Tax=Asticcacaulis sp. ZE23SCel15 TaxID=3059027 RepID=UPI00265EF56A|nr:TonB-dependent siderophore receptor [Asticcacaulis sp. ZE23SCel15]WKL55773.1 TonB-dependent siderophore receptor [Asticcacaulis sp. ZE23SCel15]